MKKILILHLLMINSAAQAYEFKEKDIKTMAASGVLISAIICTGYLWATSGDSVEQRIHDAQIDLATMPEYEQEFDMTPTCGEKETQIQSNLKLLGIDTNNLDATYDQKLQADIVTLQKTYNNLWFKSFYGGQEIAAITRKTNAYKTKAQKLVQYLQEHAKYLQGYQIIHELGQLSHRSLLQNKDEITKLAQSYDVKCTYPLFNYVKKIQKDLECIEFLISQKSAQENYPLLSKKIAEYQVRLEEMKLAISSMEAYKHEALGKLEADIILLQEKHQALERLVKQLQVDVQLARMR